MKHSLMWSMLAIFAIACFGFFGAASQGPPGFGHTDAQLLHTTFGIAYVGVLVSVATLFAGLGLLSIAHQVLGGRLPRWALALLMYTNSLMARLANYTSATRRAISSESHYRNSRTYAVSR